MIGLLFDERAPVVENDIILSQLDKSIRNMESRLDSIESLLKIVVANSILDELEKAADNDAKNYEELDYNKINKLLDTYRLVYRIEIGEVEEFNGYRLLHIIVPYNIPIVEIKRIHNEMVDVINDAIPFFEFEDKITTRRIRSLVDGTQVISFCCPSIGFYHISPYGYTGNKE